MHRLCLLLMLLGWAGCSHSLEVVNEVLGEFISPNGKNRLVVFSRIAGATTGFNTQASLLQESEPLPEEEGGNFLILDKGEAKFSWKQDGGILVEYQSGARIFKKEEVIRGIAVEYREK